jgi:hypothetical protein
MLAQVYTMPRIGGPADANLSVDAPVTVANCAQSVEARVLPFRTGRGGEDGAAELHLPDLRCGGRYSGVAKCVRRPETRLPIEASRIPSPCSIARGRSSPRPPFSCSFHTPQPAQDVELRSFDGTVELEGNLIAYDGAYYQIDTIYGPLTVSAEGVSCAGPRLSRPDQFRGRGLYRGRRDRGRGALTDLLSAFAAQQDLELRSEERTAATSSTRSFGPMISPPPGSSCGPGTTDEGFLAL